MQETNWRIKFLVLDLISASLKAPEKRECDENNNNNNNDDEPKPPKDDESDEKVEKVKPKKMVGLFPLDLRSELKNRLGGGGFNLKKSTTNVDIFSKKSEPIAIKLPELPKAGKPSDLRKSMQVMEISKKVENDSDDEGGMEKLSFKEKLQLIERSSSRNLVNPL